MTTVLINTKKTVAGKMFCWFSWTCFGCFVVKGCIWRLINSGTVLRLSFFMTFIARQKWLQTNSKSIQWFVIKLSLVYTRFVMHNQWNVPLSSLCVENVEDHRIMAVICRFSIIRSHMLTLQSNRILTQRHHHNTLLYFSPY